MNATFVLLSMIFMHIIDDYVLQDVLAKMKQKSWWTKQLEYKDMYKHDYIVALACHSFEWTFMVMLPIAYWKYSFNIDIVFASLFVFNMILHMVTDNAKANIGSINLICDQLIHLTQIIVTFVSMIVIH